MKTIITHFYNEEYLLPWWLNHHKNLFDHGVLIDYGSTDRSVEIIKEICPTWEIIKSKNEVFDAELCDREVEEIEKNIEGWRIALTITEFLLGDINSLCTDTLERTQYLIPTLLFAEFDPEKDLDTNKELWDQIKMGCGYYSRSLHNYNDIEYAWSRHYLEHRANDKAMIFKYAYALIGRKMIDRRKTMFSKFSDRDKENNRGTTINYLPDDSLKSWYENYMNHTLSDCSQHISKFALLTPKPAKPDYTKNKTIITHFYNEEFLLPFWLNHHKQYFDHGILIDYNSTDRSVEIIKEICPTWEIIKSRNNVFDAEFCDREIEDIEKNIVGWRIALTVTEFLLVKFSDLFIESDANIQWYVPSIMFCEYDPNRNIDTTKPLWEQFKNGVFFMSRSLHNFTDIKYPTGRHYSQQNANDKAIIFKYNYCLVGPNMVKRKKQLYEKISDRDKALTLGTKHHYAPEDQLEEWYKKFVNPLLFDCYENFIKPFTVK